MAGPRRTSGGTAGRRPARPGARGTARPTTRVGGRTSSRRTAVAGTPSLPVSTRRTGLTGRAAVLVLVVAALLVSAALPLREFLAQRGDIGEMRAQQAATRERVAGLQAEKLRLADPAYVAAEARRRLHYVLPGETAYVVLQPSPAPASDSPVRAAAPWYSQLWGSVQAADEPAPAPAP